MSTQNLNFSNQLCRVLIARSRFEKIGMMLMADAFALPICFLCSLLLKIGNFNEAIRYSAFTQFLVVMLTIFSFISCGLYRAVIRFIDFKLLSTTGIGLAFVIGFTYLCSFVFGTKEQFNSVLMIYWFVAFSYVISSRLVVRAFLRTYRKEQDSNKNMVAIYGAGERGAELAVAMRASADYFPKCFFDEKHTLIRRTIEGLRVFHSENLLEVVNKYGINSIVIAIPTTSPERLLKIVQMMRQARISVKIQRRLFEFSDEKIIKNSIRDIKIEDLLGRDRVSPRIDLISKCVTGKNILVTGAGGSVGSEMCRQIVLLHPESLHLLDHCEFALYSIQKELQSHDIKFEIVCHLGSVCNASLVERILSEGKIHTVYHAAAYKHVPIVEDNISESIRNNVMGAKVVAAMAQKNKVETCVLISSDKAVRPTNIMGATKRIAELIFQAAGMRPNNKTTFCMVRFGNVLGSSGSVVPLFQNQIASGGPITITHPDVIRYFMLIQEAAELVIQAGAMAVGGDVFVLDMGKPIKIVDLARTMLAMSGITEKTNSNQDGEIEIKYVGLRPGEKMYEELLIGDNAYPSQHPRIMYAKENVIHFELLDKYIEDLIRICEVNNRHSIEFMVRNIVAEYQPNNIRDLTISSKLATSTVQKQNIQWKPVSVNA
jgi:FlaA1/EpsC-like NDP-sugar epimerase